MIATEAVEIGSATVEECSRRLLSVLSDGGSQGLRRELSRAKRVYEPFAAGSSLTGEQVDLLDAIVERMCVSPCGDTELFLLEHLAKSRKESGLKNKAVAGSAPVRRLRLALDRAGSARAARRLTCKLM